MTEQEVRGSCHRTLASALAGWDADVRDAVLAQVALVAYRNDADEFINSILAITSRIIGAKVAAVRAWAAQLRRQNDQNEADFVERQKRFEEFRALATSKTIH